MRKPWQPAPANQEPLSSRPEDPHGRERIRRSLAGDHASSGLGGRVDDDWSTFERPLLCLDEINLKRKAQEKKDKTACRIGIVCTVLAGIVAVVGFQN